MQWPFKMERITALWEGRPVRAEKMAAKIKSVTELKSTAENSSPVIARAKPVQKTEPVPTIEKPKPAAVVAEVEPELVPMRQPTPPTTPVPVVKKPTVVVAEVKPEPVPMRHPTPPTTPVPVVKKPTVVVAEVKPERGPDASSDPADHSRSGC